MLLGAEHVITMLSHWTTVIELLGVRERVRGGGGAVCVCVCECEVRERGERGEIDRGVTMYMGV